MNLARLFTKFTLLLSGLVFCADESLLRAAPADLVPADLVQVNELLGEYCLDCHGTDDPAGGLELEGLDLTTPISRDQEPKPDVTARLERIVRRLQARQMPPPEASRPSDAQYQRLVDTLVKHLDEMAVAHPQPGRTDSIRRLTRLEYRNAVRDLLNLDVDVDQWLPADESSHGFDNITVSELSPVLLNRYISAAEHISRVAVGGRQRSPGGVTFRLPADQTQESHVEGLPLGTRGGALFKHTFAQTGLYEIQLRLTRDRDENVEGLHGTHQIDVLMDRRRVHQFSVHAPKGKAGYQRDDTNVDANLKFRFKITAGPHQIGVTFPMKSASLQEIKRQPFDAAYNRHRHPRRNPALFEVSIVGPFQPQGPGDTPSRRKIFGTAASVADPLQRATEIFQRLLPLAYRRPITESDLATPLKFFRRHGGQSDFDAGMEAALAAVLVNPSFLLRIEKDPPDAVPGQVYAINDFELASRISFFLWSSLPDQRLLDLAAAKKLRDPETLDSEVKRMLRDPRSDALVENFAAQWLYLRNLASINPD
ncbi:MAG: DUF1592 domain-containing protein, partial [Pirellulales bacterium]|nr:DUF1592 domain-containing protein [Pirellulales bacterium]